MFFEKSLFLGAGINLEKAGRGCCPQRQMPRSAQTWCMAWQYRASFMPADGLMAWFLSLILIQSSYSLPRCSQQPEEVVWETESGTGCPVGVGWLVSNPWSHHCCLQQLELTTELGFEPRVSDVGSGCCNQCPAACWLWSSSPPVP